MILLPRSLTKDQLRDLWEALRKNDVRGLQKFEEFLGKVSGEIRRAKLDSEQLESALKRYEHLLLLFITLTCIIYCTTFNFLTSQIPYGQTIKIV